MFRTLGENQKPAIIHPCVSPSALIAVFDQQCPGIDLFQFNSTGVHCGKITAASIKLVIVLKAIKDQKKTFHCLLVKLYYPDY